MRNLLLSALVLPCALSLAAQEASTRAVQERPVLVMKTAEVEILLDAADTFGHHEQIPDLDEGCYYVLSVGSDRVAAVRTERGPVRFMELSVDPGGLMELFADEIGEVRGIAQGLGVMAMAQQGIKPEEAKKMVAAVFDFPHTLENATFILLTNSKAAPSVRDIVSKGLSIEVSITAKEGSALAKSLEVVRPSSAGVPQLPPSPDAMMNVQFSIGPKAMCTVFDPFMDFALSFSYSDEDTRAKARAVWTDMLKLCDGGFAVSIGKNMEMEGLYGFLDSDALAAFIGSEEYLEMMRSQRPSRDIEVEVKANAFVHRDVQFAQMILYNDGPANPMMPDGEMRSYFGGIGNYMVLGGSEKGAKRLADAVADGKVVRKPLADGAVAQVDIDLKEWFSAVVPSMPGHGGLDDVPTKMSVRLLTKGRTLTIKVEAK